MSLEEPPLDTIDESVRDTLYRDLRTIAIKLKYVLVPLKGSQEDTLKELRNWDLWGPLLLCLMLSVVLSLKAPADQTSLVFAAVFVIIWCGAFVVTLNAKLLGGKISFFQSVCVLGYCVFPLNISAVLSLVAPLFFGGGVLFAVRFAAVVAGFVWSTRASVVFMSQLVKEERKVLAVYPVFLFYIVIGWIVMLH